MKTSGHHFRIVSPSGEILYDSAKFRVNRFASESQAENIGRSKLAKFQNPGVAILVLNQAMATRWIGATVKTYDAE